MTPKFFDDQHEFRIWLSENHERSLDLIVGFYKKSSGLRCMTWSQSVDQAICFGWIDGLRRRIDEASYSIRFTPRKSTSIWSAVNIAKVERLTDEGLMQPAGIAAFEKRTASRTNVYAYENDPAELSPEFEKTLRANVKGYAFFRAQAPSYQRTIIHWIMRAKQESTRLARLEKTIDECSNERRMK